MSSELVALRQVATGSRKNQDAFALEKEKDSSSSPRRGGTAAKCQNRKRKNGAWVF